MPIVLVAMALCGGLLFILLRRRKKAGIGARSAAARASVGGCFDDDRASFDDRVSRATEIEAGEGEEAQVRRSSLKRPAV